MKFPEKISILDHNITVVQQSLVNAVGAFKLTDSQIRLEETLKDDLKLSTLMHEIMHGISHLQQIDLTEQEVDILAMGLNNVLRNNPDFVKLFLEDFENA